MISRDEAERQLVGLRAAHDRVATAMFAIDTHPALGLLRSSTLSGLTRDRAATLLGEVDRLWAQFTLFGEVLDQLRSLIEPRRPTDAALIETEQLLRERLLHLDAAGMPVTGGGPATAALSVGELARQLEQGTATLAGHLAEVDAAWSAIGARIAPLMERVDAAATLATDLGETGLADRLRTQVTEVNRVDLGDPLAAAPGGRLAGAAAARMTSLSDAVDAAQARLRELTLLRDGYPQRVAALGTLLDQLAAAESGVAQTQARVREKIADPALGAVPDATAVLRTRLADLDRLRHDRRWGDLADDLSTVESSARQALAYATGQRDSAEGLIARRDELRGRLSAYRAKAGQQGLAEHEELSELHERAQQLLYTAPCDLRAATLVTVLAALGSDAPGRPAATPPGGTP
jgi:hypothetical protein